MTDSPSDHEWKRKTITLSRHYDETARSIRREMGSSPKWTLDFSPTSLWMIGIFLHRMLEIS
jgi:hypothetical protein